MIYSITSYHMRPQALSEHLKERSGQVTQNFKASNKPASLSYPQNWLINASVFRQVLKSFKKVTSKYQRTEEFQDFVQKCYRFILKSDPADDSELTSVPELNTPLKLSTIDTVVPDTPRMSQFVIIDPFTAPHSISIGLSTSQTSTEPSIISPTNVIENTLNPPKFLSKLIKLPSTCPETVTDIQWHFNLHDINPCSSMSHSWSRSVDYHNMSLFSRQRNKNFIPLQELLQWLYTQETKMQHFTRQAGESSKQLNKQVKVANKTEWSQETSAQSQEQNWINKDNLNPSTAFSISQPQTVPPFGSFCNEHNHLNHTYLLSCNHNEQQGPSAISAFAQQPPT